MTNTLGIQSRPPQLAELEEGQSVTVLLQPKTLGDGAPVAAQYREYKRVGSKLLSWVAKDMSSVDSAEVFPNTVTVSVIPAGEADYDKFLVSNGGVITYRTAAQMISDLGIATADHVHAVSDLTDMVITGPADLDVLQYNGSNWVDRTLAEAGISAVGQCYTKGEIDAMNLVDYTGTPANNQIATFTDVDTIQGEGNLTWDGSKLGVGVAAPDSILHIKANVAGTVGSHPAGQLIIQDPDDTVFGNAVITGYESDGAGNPDQQLWYLGSSSSSNSDIIFLNRRNSKLQLGTSGAAKMTILGDGNVGIGTAAPVKELHVGGGTDATFQSYAGITANVAAYAQISARNSTSHVEIGMFAHTSIGYLGTWTNHELRLRTNNADVMTLLENGNVGIGTAAPTSPSGISKFLHIANSDHAGIVLEDTGDASAFEVYAQTLHLYTKYNTNILTTLKSTGEFGVGTLTVPYLLTLKDTGDAGSVTFSSGWSGTGWNLDHITAHQYHLELESMTIRGALNVYELIINTIHSVDGGMIISKGHARIASVSGTHPNETIVLEDPSGHGASPFKKGDIVMVQRIAIDETSVVRKEQRQVKENYVSGLTLTLEATAGGEDNANIQAGDVLVVLGNIEGADGTAGRDASIFLSASETNNPFIRFKDGVHSVAEWNGVTKIVTALGNLNGVYGYAAETYGFAAGDPAGPNITVDPTNGIRIRATTTTLAQLTGTAFTMQSAGSGQRIVISGTDNNMTFYDADGEVVRIDDSIIGESSGIKITGDDSILYVYKSDAVRAWLLPYQFVMYSSETGDIAHLKQTYSGASATKTLKLENENLVGTAAAIWISTGEAYKPGGGDWVDTSDLRVKKNIADYALGLEALLQLNPVSFQYNGLADGAPDDGRTYVGLVAQDAEKIIPSIVSAHKAELDGKSINDLRMMDASELKYMTINATKELHARIVELEGEVATLRTQLGLA